MSEQSAAQLERMDELLCDHVTCGLSDSGELELGRLVEGSIDEAGLDMEIAAAALAIAVLPSRDAAAVLPARLRETIEAEATGGRAVAGVIGPAPARAMRINWFPWALAAASLTLAVLGWWPRLVGGRVAGSPEVLARESGTVTTRWARWSPKAPTEDPEAKEIDWAKGVQGRVIWNAEMQEGFMYFSGMRPNDPREFQYQLWIIDAEQTHPVDGGVFDIPTDVGSKDVVVRITPKIHVSQAAAFAVTIEKPGGVVVSEQHERVVVASVAK